MQRQQGAVALGESGIRTFELIADRWKLTRSEREAMLGMPRSSV
jgi:hypothetical protein